MRLAPLFLVSLCISLNVEALPITKLGVIAGKFLKGSDAAKDAVVEGGASTAGHAFEGSAAKAFPHPPSSGEYKPSVFSGMKLNEPLPNLAAELTAKNVNDVAVYKKLRLEAKNGNAASMVQMADMTASGRVADSGLPCYGYWLVHATRISVQYLPRLKSECNNRGDMRSVDPWFDYYCTQMYSK